MEKKSVVLYKNQAAVIEDRDGDKYLVRYLVSAATPTGKKAVYGEQKVREKDIILLHNNPCSSLENILAADGEKFTSMLHEAWELLQSDDSTAFEPLSFSDLADLACSGIKTDEIWAFYKVLASSSEFLLNQNEIKNGNLIFTPRSQTEIDALNQKNYEKEHEAEIREAFIARLKQKKLNLPEDAKFMGEVEAFALCKTEKSKVMQEAGFSQTIEKAHKLLIDTGIWDYTKNPHPSRFGFSFSSASEQLGPMPEEERVEVPGISYAIDSEHSNDPDDAVAWDGQYLWVHIADPASSVLPDSKIDIAARGRGTTLYIPEGASRMLCESALEDYALGLKEDSRALSFRLKLTDDCQIDECTVLKTKITVHRMTYKEAEDKKESPELKPLFEIARKNKARREENHAVTIQMPEVDITVDKETKKVTVAPDEKYESNGMIAELMVLAGEGAAKFAFKNQIPFPFVSQEAPEFPDKIPDGLAGDFAKIKCMRKRSVGITPAPHAGLGLSFYSQVTSPLRRYGDLIAHQQLRAFIDGRRLMPKDEMLEKVAAGDAASIAAKKASRKSDTHWKLVYLLQNPELTFEGVCIDIRGNEALFLIPLIDMQATIKGITDIELNDKRTLKMKKVDIPELSADFEVV
ncbi:RNB domain-containing ribonuclease [Treponema sp. C6A8]|uniref:RNB domain-containing ribonuclease n=1 Tax=Treponema sp. C6A8 TaxID=1410609 RepID=UPI00048569B5|nr:RNB domain-containing ribonuclease [Treponema sp. C6A8]